MPDIFLGNSSMLNYQTVLNELINTKTQLRAQLTYIEALLDEIDLDYETKYLTFEAIEDCEFQFNGTGNNKLYYCKDNVNWIELNAEETVSLEANATIKWKGSCISQFGIGQFVSNGKFNAYGNIMSLIYGDDYTNKKKLFGKDYIFANLFKNTEIVNAENLILSGTILSAYCYFCMFYGCSYLEKAPLLPAITLEEHSYDSTFYNCSSLSEIKCLAENTVSENCLHDWCYGINNEGTLYKAESFTNLESDILNGWNKLDYYKNQYLTFEILEDTEFSFSQPTNIVNTLSYSLNGGKTWQTLENGAKTPTIKIGSKVLWRGAGIEISNESPIRGIGSFESNGKFNAYGNIMSLLYEDDFIDKDDLSDKDYVFNKLFKNTKIVNAKNLKLPALDLADYCYNQMFFNCQSMEYAPELPALDLEPYCYNQMFYNCTSLSIAPALPSSTLVQSCYSNMFQNCSSLLAAPALNATTLVENCYMNMFNGCSSLKYVRCLATDISANNCTTNWLSNVASLGTFIKDENNSNWSTDANGIPNEWIIKGPNDSSTDEIELISDYFAIIPKTSGTISFSQSGLYYSTNCQNWTSMGTSNINVTAGVPIYLSGLLEINDNKFGIGTFNSTCIFEIAGNIMSLIYDCVALLDYNHEITNYTYLFYELFKNCTTLISAKNLILDDVNVSKACFYSMFEGCSALTEAPELPALSLADYCYYQMFKGCTSLVNMPELPATTLANCCYQSMFENCTSLFNLTELPATSLNKYCYANMFKNCSSLVNTSELLANILAPHCYEGMFMNCTELRGTPDLFTTSLEEYCYCQMFQGCTELTLAPELPATELKRGCYKQMFYGCTSLISSPSLNATKLSIYCYQEMLSGCSSLNYVICLAIDKSGLYCTLDWLNNISETGIFIKSSFASWSSGSSGIPSTWKIKNKSIISNNVKDSSVDQINEYFTIIPKASGTVTFSQSGLYYSTNKTSWTSMGTSAINVTNNIPVYIKGNMTPKYDTSNGIYGIGQFSSSCYFDVAGNIMSLLYGDEFDGKVDLTEKGTYTFCQLFKSCSNLINAKDLILPATTLTNYCYSNMFYSCTSLTIAPELPATTLADYCYQSMFYNCASLVTAPEKLPATTLRDYCYYQMFGSCTSLTTAPTLSATTLAPYCCQNMFASCSSLTTAPTLSATTLRDYCYRRMFQYCTSLSYVRCLAKSNISTTNCNNWLNGVASSGIFAKKSSASWTTNSTSGIPSGWTSQNV